MPDQELERTQDRGEPDDALSAAQPAAGPDDELQDTDLRDEIELVADLVVAASASEGPLSLAEIDRILGVRAGLIALRAASTPSIPSGPGAYSSLSVPSSARPRHHHGALVRFRLTPQDTSFYDLFLTSAQHLVVGSQLLTEVMGAPRAEREALAQKMREAEHAADESTHEIMRKVNSSFITPFDREDIYALASTLDDCMDLMEAAVDLIVLYRIDELPAGVSGPGRGAGPDGRADRRGDATAARR